MRRPLPPEYMRTLRALEDAYLAHDDPIRQSGFSGGAERWRAEREPILDAVEQSGDFLDICCANGYLLECLRAWARERGFSLTPHGLDLGRRLVALAAERLPDFSDNFHVGNAWDWQPPRRYDYVYTLNDCVPIDYLADYLSRLLVEVVAPGGRLILGAYGSRSRREPPLDVRGFLETMGLSVAGASQGGLPPVTVFAWVDA
jgi:SAM-dependent methyltransferase